MMSNKVLCKISDSSIKNQRFAPDRQTDTSECSIADGGSPRRCRGFGARQVSKATTPKSMAVRRNGNRRGL